MIRDTIWELLDLDCSLRTMKQLCHQHTSHSAKLSYTTFHHLHRIHRHTHALETQTHIIHKHTHSYIVTFSTTYSSNRPELKSVVMVTCHTHWVSLLSRQVNNNNNTYQCRYRYKHSPVFFLFIFIFLLLKCFFFSFFSICSTQWHVPFSAFSVKFGRWRHFWSFQTVSVMGVELSRDDDVEEHNLNQGPKSTTWLNRYTAWGLLLLYPSHPSIIISR